MPRHLRPLTQPVRPCRPRAVALFIVGTLLAAGPGIGLAPAQDKSAVTDGSAVLTAGRLHLNITNFGLLGSRYSVASTYSNAPSCQWPGGTGHEYLYGAGLWVGALKNGLASVTCAQPISEMSPPAAADGVIYEATNRIQVRPGSPHGTAGTPGDLPDGDDDGDGRRDEDPLDGRDNDDDGLVDEDFAQRGAQMFTCMMRDDTGLVRQLHPDHRPLGIRIYQEACVWDDPVYEDIVGLRFTITNVSNAPLEEVYVGLFVDADIARHEEGTGGADDLAGSFAGLVRQVEGYYEDVAYAWMRDADSSDALPGWLGVTLDGDGIGYAGVVHPETYGVNAIRIVNMEAVGGRTALPFLDSERYEILARPGRDPDVPTHDQGNYAIILSVGPYTSIAPGQRIVIDASFTVAVGAGELQRRMRQVLDVAGGRWYNADRVFSSGYRGRETMICAEDYATPWNNPDNPLFRIYKDYWQDYCRRPGIGPLRYAPEDFSWNEELRKHCIWVNLDNCEECKRYYGEECNGFNYALAPCWSTASRALGACTGSAGRETRLAWISGVSLPPSPWIRAVPRDGAVEIYWDDRSEHQRDEITGNLDFESYRIWQSANWSRPAGTSEETGPPSQSWSLEAEYDLINHFESPPGSAPLPFGENTGIEHLVYRPACLDDPRFAGLQDLMAAVVLNDTQGRWVSRPTLRTPDGAPVPELTALLPWETYPDVLDTMFALATRPDSVGVPKRATRYYRYRDEHVHNGFIYFYAVTATDHQVGEGGVTPSAPGSGRLPSGSFVVSIPRAAARDAAVRRRTFVYPNPATAASLAEFQALEPSRDDPSGVRIAFAELPRCRSVIKIFTLAGDLVQSIEHDGSHGDGQASWNLISRNGQEVVNGIYLFTVEPREGGFEREVGKFVIVR